MSPDDVPYLLQVTFVGLLAWFDKRLESSFSSVRPCAIFAHMVLSDVVSEKIKADVSIVRIEGMSYAAFARLQAQSYLI